MPDKIAFDSLIKRFRIKSEAGKTTSPKPVPKVSTTKNFQIKSKRASPRREMRNR